MNSYYVVFTQRIASKLMEAGFCLIGIQESRKRNGKKVFLFNDSFELRSKVQELINEGKEKSANGKEYQRFYGTSI